MNSKNTNHRHISLTGTDHCDFRLSEKLKFERKPFFNIPENLQKKRSYYGKFPFSQEQYLRYKN